MFSRKKAKKNSEREQLFKREAYIPKKRLDKKERTLPKAAGRKGGGQADRHQKRRGRKAVVFILWLLFFAEVAYVTLFANFFAIQSFELQREGEASSLSNQQIQEYAESAWQGKWLGIIPKNNLLLLRPDLQKKRLQERFPRFDSIHIDRSFPEKLILSITEKPFQILWCRNEDCYLVEKDGKVASAEIFFRYPEEQGKVVRIQDTAEAPVSIGTLVLAPEDQRFIEDIMKDFTLRTELHIQGSIERPNMYAREMRIRTDKDFTIFFNTRLPVSQSLNSLMLVLKKEIPEGEWEKVDYIDLRTENRIYYTRKDRVPEKTEAQKLREEEQKKKQEEEDRKKEESQAN